MPASPLRLPVNGLGLKLLVNCQMKRYKQSQRSDTKICCLISLFIKATIPGTHGIIIIVVAVVSGHLLLKEELRTSGSTKKAT